MVTTKSALVAATFVLSLFSSFTLAHTFTGNQIINGVTYFILPVTVTSGSNLIIQSGLFHKFFQRVTNRGGLYICETKSSHIGMTVVNIGNIFNYGTYVIDDSLALTGLLFESFGVQFLNTGDFFLVGRKALITGSHYRIWSLTFTNTGLMAFYQTGSSNFLSTVEIGPDTLFDLLHIKNTGTICLRAVNLHARVAFDGESGCVDVGAYATLTLNHLISRSFRSQTIYMSDSSSIVYVKALLGITSLKIRGWGNTNQIFFKITITTYTYNNVTGILTVIDGLNLFRIDIGPGYDMSQMYRVTHHLKLGSGLTYISDSPDTSRPANCAECVDNPTCEDAINGKSSLSTVSNTFTQTDLPAPYTTTVTETDTTETQLISFYWTTDINGSSFIVETTYTLTAPGASSSLEASEVSSASSEVSTPVSSDSEVSTPVSSASSEASTPVSSASADVTSDSESASASSTKDLSYYTTTRTGASTTETLIISDYTTTDNNGNTITMESTYTITASEKPLSTYTTTVVIDGTTTVYVVCDYTTTDSNGNTVTLVSSYPCITEGTATTYTRTITAEICTSTVVVCACTSTKSNGETVSVLTTYPATYTPTDMSGNSYTTTVVVPGTVTEVVECDYLTTDAQGNTYTVYSTIAQSAQTTEAKNGASVESTTTVTNTAVATKTASQVVQVQSSAAAQPSATHTVSDFTGAGSILRGSVFSMIAALLFLVM